MNKRNKIIAKLFESGETLQAIGSKYGLSRERVRQIVSDSVNQEKYKPDLVRLRAAKQIIKKYRVSYAEMAEAIGYSAKSIPQVLNLRTTYISQDRKKRNERLVGKVLGFTKALATAEKRELENLIKALDKGEWTE